MRLSGFRPRTFVPTLCGVLVSPLLSSCGGDGPNDPDPVPVTAAVTIGDFLFHSDRNKTENPAVDTVAVGGTVTWTWREGEHDVQSLGPPSFADGPAKATPGATYRVTFTSAGRYEYDCAIHGSAMTGIIVVR